MSSRSGEETAASAAARARPSPLAAPDPIIAMPVSAITVRTSAKSTLMRPGRVMSSAMPWTAPCNTWFAALKASRSVVCGPNTVNSFWLGMVISESQNFDMLFITAAHAGGDEQHVAALDQLDDAVAVLHRRLTADFRVGARPQPLGDVAADLQRRLHLGVLQGL